MDQYRQPVTDVAQVSQLHVFIDNGAHQAEFLETTYIVDYNNIAIVHGRFGGTYVCFIGPYYATDRIVHVKFIYKQKGDDFDKQVNTTSYVIKSDVIAQLHDLCLEFIKEKKVVIQKTQADFLNFVKLFLLFVACFFVKYNGFVPVIDRISWISASIKLFVFALAVAFHYYLTPVKSLCLEYAIKIIVADLVVTNVFNFIDGFEHYGTGFQ
jgi:hypothetical protein